MTRRADYRDQPVAGLNLLTPVLEIGGTHVTAALLGRASAPGAPLVLVRRQRLALDPDASADVLIGRFARAVHDLQVWPDGRWGIAVPDPFDYVAGIGRFTGVGKFAALNGVDLRAALARELETSADMLHFLNDADAFVLGEWTAGAAAGSQRCVGITLGTGVGSGWLVDGRPVDPGNPPGGRIHRLHVDGAPLEDVVSRRAIRRAYVALGGDPQSDVREIAAAARSGEARARRVLDHSFEALGRVVATCAADFGAEVLVIGGSMAASWDLFEPAFRAGAGTVGLPEVRLARDSEASPLLGAALFATGPGPWRG